MITLTILGIKFALGCAVMAIKGTFVAGTVATGYVIHKKQTKRKLR